METRKITLIATIAVISLIAVGIGYAYTASTTNSGNVVSTEFVELKQTNVDTNLTGAYQFVPNGFNIYYDSENVSATVTNYIITNAKVQINTNGNTNGGVYTAIKMGNPFKLTATQTGGTPTNMTCNFETTLFNTTNGWDFIIEFKGETGDPTYAICHDGTWSVSSFLIKTKGESSALTYEDTTITVYYGYSGNDASTTYAPNSQPLGNATTGATIKFTVEKGAAITEADTSNIATINRTMANPGELVTVTITEGKTATITVAKTGETTTTVETSTTGQITTFVMPDYAVTVTITDTTTTNG